MHGITRNAAYFLLRNDISRVEDECKKNIPFWNELDDERQYALLDMCFQMGVGGLKGFKKMIAAMGVGNWNKDSEECQQEWPCCQGLQRWSEKPSQG